MTGRKDIDMMYNEFIDLTGYEENYITYKDYTENIEPVYMESDLDKKQFCKAFCKAHDKCVNTAVNMAISAKTLEEKWDYALCGKEEIMADVHRLHEQLKEIFLKALHSNIFIDQCKLRRAS